jgi:hypothetical protein
MIITNIGKRVDGYHFNGSIDEFRIYNRALSTGEIQTLYTTNLAKYASNRRTFTSILSGLAEGIYLYSGRVIDLAGYTANTETRTLTIDRTLPTTFFTGATPANNAWLSGNIFTIQQDFTELNLGQFIRNRSGVNYPMYDSGLLLMIGFDKVSNLGESTGTIKDLSIYNTTISVSGSPLPTNNAKRGNAYQFSNSSLSVGSLSGLNTTNNITVATRVKFDFLDYTNNTGKLMFFGRKGIADNPSPHS